MCYDRFLFKLWKKRIMPYVSKYSDQQIESVIMELLKVLKTNNASRELSLMCLGNTVSNIIDDLPIEQRKKIVENFSAALKVSAGTE